MYAFVFSNAHMIVAIIDGQNFYPQLNSTENHCYYSQHVYVCMYQYLICQTQGFTKRLEAYTRVLLGYKTDLQYNSKQNTYKTTIHYRQIQQQQSIKYTDNDVKHDKTLQHRRVTK